MDAGSLNRLSYLDFILSNLLSYLRPILFRVYKNFTGTKEAYVEAIKEILTDVKNHGLIPTGIVADNLPIACGCHSQFIILSSIKLLLFNYSVSTWVFFEYFSILLFVKNSER